MRARNLVAVGLVTAVAAACSKPNTESTASSDPDFASELELAIFGADQGQDVSAQVISALELGQPDAAGASAAPVAEPPQTPAPDPVVKAQEPTPAVALLGEPVLTPDEPDLETVGPVAVAGGAQTDHAGHGGMVQGPGRSAGPGIIIRGGVSGRDPCARHGPGGGGVIALGPIGVMINDRVPPGAGVVDPSRGRPSTAGRGGMGAPTFPTGGRTGSTRGGGMFPGGIR